MFSPDGTLISASAAPHCGGQIKERKLRLYETKKKKRTWRRLFPVELFVRKGRRQWFRMLSWWECKSGKVERHEWKLDEAVILHWALRPACLSEAFRRKIPLSCSTELGPDSLGKIINCRKLMKHCYILLVEWSWSFFLGDSLKRLPFYHKLSPQLLRNWIPFSRQRPGNAPFWGRLH